MDKRIKSFIEGYEYYIKTEYHVSDKELMLNQIKIILSKQPNAESEFVKRVQYHESCE